LKIIIRRPRRPILAPPRRPSRPRASPPASRASRARDDARARARDAHLFDRASLFRVSDSTTLEPRRSVRARVASRVASFTTRSSVDRSASRASSIVVDARATTCARASRGPAAVDALAKPSFTYSVLYAQFADVAKNRDRARSIAPALRAIDGASIAIDARSTARRSTRDVAAARRTRADDRAGPPLRRAHRSRVMAVGKNKRMSKGKKGGKKKACVRDATANDREATREATGRGSIDATGERGTRDDDDDGRRRGG
jgi:hypothetical protein